MSEEMNGVVQEDNDAVQLSPNVDRPFNIKSLIYIVQNQQVMLDSDLAALYQVETKVLNQAVKRNIPRFPEKFCFQLTSDEFEVLKSQFVTSNLNDEKESKRGGRKTMPYVFNEQGIARKSLLDCYKGGYHSEFSENNRKGADHDPHGNS